MRAVLAAMVIVWGCAKKSAPPPRLEVCPDLDASTLGLFAFSAAWPNCPVAAPITTFEGRCLDAPSCMQPCRAETLEGDQVSRAQRFTYDAAGRLTELLSRDFKLQVTSTTSCTYGPHGPQRCFDGADETRYFYDHGRLKLIKRGDLQHDFTYDVTGRLVGEVQHGGQEPTKRAYEYDAQGRVVVERSHIEKVGGDRYNVLETSFHYVGSRLASRIRKLHTASSADVADVLLQDTTTFQHDAAGRVSGLTNVHIDRRMEVASEQSSSTTYRYDDRGRFIESVETSSDGKVQTHKYSYDCTEQAASAKRWHAAVEPSERVCSGEHSCHIADQTCGGCCDDAPIAHDKLDAFLARLNKTCAGYAGAFCDCKTPKQVSACTSTPGAKQATCVLMTEAEYEASKRKPPSPSIVID